MPDASAASEETSRGSQDADGWQATDCSNPNGDNRRNEGTITVTQNYPRAPRLDFNTEMASCFLRLTSLDKGAFERLIRYETALWRQVGQVLVTLECMRWRR
jgi:hypothetical protein